MALKAVISRRSTQPRQYTFPCDANEREAARIENKADRGYLAELQQLIESRKFFKSRLRNTLGKVQVRINQRQTAVADQRYLPNEILGWIFALVGYEPYRRFVNHFSNERASSNHSLVSAQEWALRSPLNICHVCSRWREVALSTPSLWNSLVLDTRKKRVEQMMEHWFKHAKAVPLQVTIWQEIPSKRSPRKLVVIQKILLSIVVILGSHIRQVASMRICCQDSTERARLDAPDLTTILETLQLIKSPSWKTLTIDSMDVHLTGGRWTSLLPAVPPQTCHSLTALHIRGYLPSTMFFPHIPSQLRTLKLDMPSSSKVSRVDHERRPDILALLAGLPQLERLRLQGRDRELSTRPSSMPSQRVRLPHLKKLTMGGYYMASHLTCMVAPNLQTLKLKGGTYPAGELNEDSVLVQWGSIQKLVCSFVEQSGASITNLTFKAIGKGLQSRPLAACLWVMPDLRHLVVVELPGTYLLNVLVDILTLSDPQKPWITFCPLLETLEWRTMGSSRMVDWQRLSSARESLTIRRHAFKDAMGALEEKMRFLHEEMQL